MQNKGEHFIPVGQDKLMECLPEFDECSESERTQLIELFDLLSTALHAQTQAFLETKLKFTNPMFNIKTHACSITFNVVKTHVLQTLTVSPERC